MLPSSGIYKCVQHSHMQSGRNIGETEDSTLYGQHGRTPQSLVCVKASPRAANLYYLISAHSWLTRSPDAAK